MQKGAKATNSAHRGVQVVQIRTNLVLRWRDPVTRKFRDQSLGLVSAAEAKAAAVSKKAQLDLIKRKFAMGELSETPTGANSVLDWISLAEAKGTRVIRELGMRYLRQMQASMMSRGLNELQRQDVIRLRQIILSDSSLSPSTTNLRMRTCKTFFNFLHARGQLGVISKDIIALTLKAIKEPPAKHGQILNPIQIRDVFSMMLLHRKPASLFFLLKLLTGLRIGELIQVRSEDVVIGYGDKPYLQVHSKKTNSLRKINLSCSPMAAKILLALKSNTDGFLFFPEENDRHREPVAIYDRFKKPLTRFVSTKLGYRVTPKDLRSTHSALLMSLPGWQLHKVAKQMDHGIEIASRHYSENVQMIDYGSGDSIEQLASVEDIGLKIIEANGLTVTSLENEEKLTEDNRKFEETIVQDRLSSAKEDDRFLSSSAMKELEDMNRGFRDQLLERQKAMMLVEGYAETQDWKLLLSMLQQTLWTNEKKRQVHKDNIDSLPCSAFNDPYPTDVVNLDDED
tara:strand:- start:337 stop:1869 length:1533 start_codon:yes stop_codon:yes gene_type:complete